MRQRARSLGRNNFSDCAPQYARFRPSYPDELFRNLAEICTRRGRAWDCGTGSGQAAVGLAGYFDRVVASDISAAQIASAEAHPRVDYAVCAGERSGLAADSVGLVSVAQALHWLDIREFYGEANRVGQAGAVLAVWTYGLPTISSAIDRLIEHFYRDVVGPYWAPERRLVEEGYRNVEFPFPEIKLPRLSMTAEWGVERFIGYLNTWSAVRNYVARNGGDPVETIARELRERWSGAGQRLRVTWPLSVRAGRIHPE